MKDKMSTKPWCVYIVLCSDQTLYTGITNDIERRISEHNNSAKGAKYTKARRPVKLMYQEKCLDRSMASKREHQIKRLPKHHKELLFKL